eukprot:16445537-Heterocapsa_arctica.AAC.1
MKERRRHGYVVVGFEAARASKSAKKQTSVEHNWRNTFVTVHEQQAARGGGGREGKERGEGEQEGGGKAEKAGAEEAGDKEEAGKRATS